MAWRVCQAFQCTPDVALRLLDRRHRDWTFAVLEAGRAERLVDTFNAAGRGEEWARKAMSGWTAADGEYFRALVADVDDGDATEGDG